MAAQTPYLIILILQFVLTVFSTVLGLCLFLLINEKLGALGRIRLETGASEGSGPGVDLPIQQMSSDHFSICLEPQFEDV